MYLHFEDHSAFSWILDKKGIPNSGTVIKVYSSIEDPRKTFRKSTLATIQLSDVPFNSEIFAFQSRDIFTGKDFEEYFVKKNFSELATKTARTLFRFSALEKTQFIQKAMSVKADGKWRINHPIEIIHLLDRAIMPGKEHAMHIDIFSQESLNHLGRFVDINNPEALLSPRERVTIDREIKRSTWLRNKER